MTSITSHDLDQDLETKLRVLTVQYGHSVEDDARQILHRAIGNESLAFTNEIDIKDKSETEKWLEETEELGVLVQATDRSKRFTPGERDPGMLKRLLSDRHE